MAECQEECSEAKECANSCRPSSIAAHSTDENHAGADLAAMSPGPRLIVLHSKTRCSHCATDMNGVARHNICCVLLSLLDPFSIFSSLIKRATFSRMFKAREELLSFAPYEVSLFLSVPKILDDGRQQNISLSEASFGLYKLHRKIFYSLEAILIFLSCSLVKLACWGPLL